jgi:argininosuccinate lyase
MVEQVERDASRLKSAYDRTNRNPLGACAITGTDSPSIAS